MTEVQSHSEVAQKDPVLEHAEAALKRSQEQEENRTDGLEDRRDDLIQEKRKVDDAITKLVAKGDLKSIADADRYQATSDRLRSRITALDEKIKKAQERGDKREAAAVKTVTDRADQLKKSADSADAKYTEAAEDAEALARLKAEKAALQARFSQTPEAERAPLLAQMKLNEQSIARLEAKDKSSEKREREAKLRDWAQKQKAEEASERVEDDEKAEEVLHRLDEEGEDKKEEPSEDNPDAKKEDSPDSTLVGSAEKQARNVESMIKKLASPQNRIDSKNVVGLRQLGLKKLWIHFVYLFSSREVTWDKNLAEGDKDYLSDIGIHFSPQENGTSKIDFTAPSKEFEPLSPEVTRVMVEYFGDEWYTRFKSLSKTDTYKDLKDKNDKADPKDADMEVFLSDMQKNGIGEDDTAVKWLEENASKMKAENPKEYHPAPDESHEFVPTAPELNNKTLEAKIKEKKYNESTTLSTVMSDFGFPDPLKASGIDLGSDLVVSETAKQVADVAWTPEKFQAFAERVSLMKGPSEMLGLKDSSLPKELTDKVGRELKEGKALSESTKVELEKAVVILLELPKKISEMTLKQFIEKEQSLSTDEKGKMECANLLAALKANNPDLEKTKSIKVSDEAKGLVDEWALTVGSDFVLGALGAELLQLKPGETMVIGKVEDQLQVVIHSGDRYETYLGKDEDSLKKALESRKSTPTTVGPKPST